MNIFSKEIVVFSDFVVAFGQRIERPSRIARSTWMLYWERLTKSS